MGEWRLKGEYGSPQQAGRLMDASEGPRMRSRGEVESLGGAATDCADVLFRSGDYYRPAVALLLTGSPCFPSSLFFPLLISAAVSVLQRCRKERDGSANSGSWMAFAPAGAEVVRESNTVRRAEAGSAHVRTHARLKAFFPL